MNRRKSERKSRSSAIVPAALGVIFLINAASGSADVVGFVLLVIVIAAAITGLAIALMKKKGADLGSADGTLKIKRRKEADLEDKPLFSKAESAAVYNENSAGELFLRDRQKRLEQLDVFLKNGIVDKAEYNILKKRYENYSYERN